MNAPLSVGEIWKTCLMPDARVGMIWGFDGERVLLYTGGKIESWSIGHLHIYWTKISD
jgi:hypothetical protein